jgi:hypothetical protein
MSLLIVNVLHGPFLNYGLSFSAILSQKENNEGGRDAKKVVAH